MSAAKEFADLKFRIECSEMRLTRVGGWHLQPNGPGEIWQDEQGALQFKIFIASPAYHALQKYMGRPGTIGELIPDDDFFILEAREHTLPRWTSQGILPTPRGGPSEGLAYGYIEELVHTQAYEAPSPTDYVRIRFRDKIEFPSNEGTQTEIRVRGKLRRSKTARNVAFVQTGDYEFEVIHESLHTVVSLRLPAGHLLPITPSRIQEALQFVLGREIVPLVVETYCAGQQITRLISPWAAHGRGRTSPPLEFHRTDEGGHVWQLFSDYFTFVHGVSAPGSHPVSRHLTSVIESTAASLDAEVLALTVAVEGLIGECFLDLAPVSSQFLGELDAVEAALEALNLSAVTRNRIIGSLNSMRGPRNSDALRAFITAQRLPAELYTSWTRLRNTSAHGGGAGGRENAIILRLKDEVLSLLYSIVFAAINYRGPRTDYSLQNWPTRTWPIAT